jgi:hypothetical protein
MDVSGEVNAMKDLLKVLDMLPSSILDAANVFDERNFLQYMKSEGLGQNVGVLTLDSSAPVRNKTFDSKLTFFFAGMYAAGKTRLGRLVAKELGVPVISMDTLIYLDSGRWLWDPSMFQILINNQLRFFEGFSDNFIDVTSKVKMSSELIWVVPVYETWRAAVELRVSNLGERGWLDEGTLNLYRGYWKLTEASYYAKNIDRLSYMLEKFKGAKSGDFFLNVVVTKGEPKGKGFESTVASGVDFLDEQDIAKMKTRWDNPTTRSGAKAQNVLPLTPEQLDDAFPKDAKVRRKAGDSLNVKSKDGESKDS